MAHGTTLILDGQMLQTNAYFRGMGGYIFGLLRAFLAARSDVRLVVILNKHMERSQHRIDGIMKRLPSAELFFLDLPYEPKPGFEEGRAVNVLDAFIAREITTDQEHTYYFIPALFMFQYCAEFPTHARKLLLFHDLMPLIYREELGKYFPNHLYFPRFKTILAADIVYCNSQTTANDLMRYIGADPGHIAVIDGSLNEQLVDSDGAAEREHSVLDRLGLVDTAYILMPTGGLENKNNIRGAQAFQAVLEQSGRNLRLVVTSHFEPLAIEELRLIAGDAIIFTDNIRNEELLVLFENAELIFMPSLYEGLGLPVLEGVAHGKPVACSDIPVFCELPRAHDALYMFDPYSVESIASALYAALTRKQFDDKRVLYSAILEKYQWARSAALFADGLMRQEYFAPRPLPKRRVAVTCPDPRKDTGVATLAQRMYGYGLQQGVEFIYFIDPGEREAAEDAPHPDYVRSLALCYDIQDVYDVLPGLNVDAILHFPAADVRFPQLLRATLSLPGYVYVGENSYAAVIERLIALGMVSTEQAAIEARLRDHCRQLRLLETPSVVAGAKGVLAVKRYGRIQRTLDWAGLDIPLLHMPEAINEGSESLTAQPAAYRKIVEFITKEQHYGA